MAVLALACFASIVRWFGAAALSRNTRLSGWERAWLGAVICSVGVEILGFGFTGSSTIAGIFGAALGFGYSLVTGSAVMPSSRRRVYTTA